MTRDDKILWLIITACIFLMAGAVTANISAGRDSDSSGSSHQEHATAPGAKITPTPISSTSDQDDLSAIKKRIQDAGLKPHPARYWKYLEN